MTVGDKTHKPKGEKETLDLTKGYGYPPTFIPCRP